MSLFNIYKTLCDGLGLAPINGSYVQALGDYFGVVDQPNKRYEDEVLAVAIANSTSGTTASTSRIESPDTFTYVETLDDEINMQTTGSISIDAQGDLIYNGNSAVAFTSLGSIEFIAEGGIILRESTTNFIQIVATLPTVDIGLAAGQLFTQTATELGGSGTQKVICIK